MHTAMRMREVVHQCAEGLGPPPISSGIAVAGTLAVALNKYANFVETDEPTVH